MWSGDSIAVLLVACEAVAQAPSRDPAELAGTAWQLVKFQGSDDTTVVPDNGSKYTIAFGRDGGLSAAIDCNRGRGTWKSSGPGQLELGPLALTLAACPPDSMHDHIVKRWGYIRSYVIRNGHLFLALMADGGLYEFEPVSDATPPSPSASVQGERRSLRGTATYRERMALPPGASFEATLEDVSKADALADVIARTQIDAPGNPPIAFEIRYDPARIHPDHRYVVRARVVVGGRLFFSSDAAYPVLTRQAPSTVALTMKRVPAQSPTPP